MVSCGSIVPRVGMLVERLPLQGGWDPVSGIEERNRQGIQRCRAVAVTGVLRGWHLGVASPSAKVTGRYCGRLSRCPSAGAALAVAPDPLGWLACSQSSGIFE